MKSSRKDIAAERGHRRVLIDLPDWLWAEIDQAAHENWRTRTAEVQQRLESTFPKDVHGAIVGATPSVRK
nr:hypothetical protein [uncultured Albidiferax sp.]